MSDVATEDIVDRCSNIGDILSGSWELTQRIFENLSYREVARLRAVCKIWADVGAKILERRRRLHYLTIHPHSIPTTQGKVTIGEVSPSNLFDGFFDHIVSKPRYCLAFCNEDWPIRTDVFSSKEGSGKLTLYQYLQASLPKTCEFGLVSSTGIIGTVETNYQGHWLESANNLNNIILSFLYGEDKDGQNECKSKQSNASQGENSKKASQRSKTATEQNSQDSKGPVNPSQAVTEKEDKGFKRSPVGYSIEVEARWNVTDRQADAVSLLLIPHHPGVQLKFFNAKGITPSNTTIPTEAFDKITSLSPEDELKALLLFDQDSTEEDESFTGALVQAALQRQNEKVAIGGGVVESLNSGVKNEGLTCFGVAISGPNVMAASVVIPKTANTPKNLELYMKQLKSCGIPEDQSLAFMFSCCGRGYSWYRRRGNPRFDYHNVETKAFRKAFPNTPIFGFFGMGEIGMNFLPKFPVPDEEDGGPVKKRKKRIFHQFSTVIVLLSFL